MDGAQKDEGFDTLKINKNFADRFEHNAKRNEKERLQLKYGKNQEDASDSSSSSEEDSDAELLNPTIEKKFIEVIHAIRTNDPKLTKSDKPLFDDDDFDDDKGKNKNTVSAKSKFTLKDQIRKHTLQKLDNDQSASDSGESGEDSDDSEPVEKSKRQNPKESKLFTKIGTTRNEEEAEIKREFKK